jgi:glycosyltransferase involved in cell wall biosynthesis
MLKQLNDKVSNLISSKLVMVGTFPPPVTGMAVTTDAMKTLLQNSGLQPNIIDIAPKSLNRAWYSRLSKIPKILVGWFIFFLKSIFVKNGVLYMGISGGFGQIYEIIFIIIARLFGWRIFIHHHSYAYLNHKQWVTGVLVKLSGPNATHIVLCEGMGEILRNSYNITGDIFSLSNIAFFNKKNIVPRKTDTLYSIGFLSNISKEKGIDVFLDLVTRLEKDKIKIKALIAGPFEDDSIKTNVINKIKSLNSVSYVGPKYGEEKEVFFKSIDVLIFPSQYINEAEGIVILEALRYEVPVIATARGCIGSNIKPELGLVIEKEQDFVDLAEQQLLIWKSNPSQFLASSDAAGKRFIELYEKNSIKLIELCEKIRSYLK